MTRYTTTCIFCAKKDEQKKITGRTKHEVKRKRRDHRLNIHPLMNCSTCETKRPTNIKNENWLTETNLRGKKQLNGQLKIIRECVECGEETQEIKENSWVTYDRASE